MEGNSPVESNIVSPPVKSNPVLIYVAIGTTIYFVVLIVLLRVMIGVLKQFEIAQKLPEVLHELQPVIVGFFWLVGFLVVFKDKENLLHLIQKTFESITSPMLSAKTREVTEEATHVTLQRSWASTNLDIESLVSDKFKLLSSFLEAKAEPEAEVEAEAKAEPEAEVEVETKAEPEAEVEAEAKAEPEAEVEVETKAEPEAEVEAEAKAEPEANLSESPQRPPIQSNYLPDLASKDSRSLQQQFKDFKDGQNYRQQFKDFEDSRNLLQQLKEFKEIASLQQQLKDLKAIPSLQQQLKEFKEIASLQQYLKDFNNIPSLQQQLKDVKYLASLQQQLEDVKYMPSLQQQLKEDRFPYIKLFIGDKQTLLLQDLDRNSLRLSEIRMRFSKFNSYSTESYFDTVGPMNFEDWFRFLTEHELVSVNDGVVSITDKGRRFLRYSDQ